MKRNKDRKQTTLLDWIRDDFGRKADFVEYASDLHKVIESFSSTKEIVRILSQHSPKLIEGIYAKAYDAAGKMLKDVLVSTNLSWRDDIHDMGIVSKVETVLKHERRFTWFKVATPVGNDEIRVPNNTVRMELHVKKNK